MCRYFLVLLLLLNVPCLTSYATPRKKVAVVLSGGGAKGVAHVGALKVIEETGIPIDCIVGTSIGAIVGGLYSLGYSPEQLESIIKQTNWMELLSDKVSRTVIPFPFKADNDKFLITYPLNKENENGGIIKGKNISQLLHQLTEGCQTTSCFDSLPIPFACIATDMAKNQKEVIRSGSLAEAMRASMAIPIIFNPVYSGDKVLVDGGFKDNLPIEVAKDMGADIIIVIDAQSELASKEKLQSVPDIINQLMLMICQSTPNDTKKLQATSYIKVNVEGYNAASFSAEALDSLIIRGENAARASYSSLLSIKEETGVVTEAERTYPNPPLVPLHFRYIPSQSNQLKVGLRFDSENIAALILNIKLQRRSIGEAEITLRGGSQSFLDTQYRIPLSKSQKIAISNRFSYNDIFLYSRGKKILNPTFIQNNSLLSYTINLTRNIQAEANVSLEYYHFFKTLTANASPDMKAKELFLNYQAGLKYETLNKRYFPTKGTDCHLKYTKYTDCHSAAVYSAFSAIVKQVLPITSHLAFIPSLYGRFIFDSNIPFIYSNMIGGKGYNPHYEQQIAFSGFAHTENVDRMFGGIQLSIQHRIREKQYLILSGDYAISKNNIPDFFHGKQLYGTSIGYGYESPLGPIDTFFCYSNRTNKLGFYINIGFGF